MANVLAELEKRRDEARLGGGQRRIDILQKYGKLPARQPVAVPDRQRVNEPRFRSGTASLGAQLGSGWVRSPER